MVLVHECMNQKIVHAKNKAFFVRSATKRKRYDEPPFRPITTKEPGASWAAEDASCPDSAGGLDSGCGAFEGFLSLTTTNDRPPPGASAGTELETSSLPDEAPSFRGHCLRK
jgi:hypothetical protein